MMINYVSKNEVGGLKNLAESVVSRHKVMRQDTRDTLERLGFTDCDLGTGFSSYTHSLQVSVMDIKSRKYLKGRFLVVGESSRPYGQYGQMYRGYVVGIREGK